MFAAFAACSLLIFSSPLSALAALSRDNSLYSHVFFIPAVSAYLVYSNRKRIFPQQEFSWAGGAGLALAASAVYAAAHLAEPGGHGALALGVISWALLVSGGFTAFYGAKAARAAAFPLAFLAFMAPLPEAATDGVTRLLQYGSTEAAWAVFSVSGAPVHRDGYFFHLPGLTVEVARQCSGIRSSMALVIAGALASHLFLRTLLGKAALMALIVPIAIVKNALRIVALTLAGYYIDERMLYGSLHTRGGMLFFAVAVLMSGALIWALRRAEGKAAKKNAAGAASPRG